MACINGKDHALEEIYSQDAGPGIEHVVRWCSRCGDVVVDVDVDSRTDPGRVMPMRFPSCVKSGAKQ